MAIWGPKLYESDCACDIKDEFTRLIESGMAPETAKVQILHSFSAAFSDADESGIARLALADVMWSHGALQDDHRAEILGYLQAGGDRWFWERNAPQLLDARKAELNRLEKRLRKPCSLKKVSVKKQLAWEVGQLYALPLTSDRASQCKVPNEFLLLYFYGDAGDIQGYSTPLAWAKITRNGHLPETAEEFNTLPFVQISCTAMADRFAPFAGEDALPEEEKQLYIPDDWGYLPEYTMMVYESRGNHPPKSLHLLGAFDGIAPPKYEYHRYQSSHGAAWRYLEDYVLERYRLHNLHQAQFYSK
ncbi:MAG TPA: hypothetical protein IAC17_02000 [Candidatus Faecousia faecipullorum]|nr:hypothetical protein [Candidatus Faecousia faecipullorum]